MGLGQSALLRHVWCWAVRCLKSTQPNQPFMVRCLQPVFVVAQHSITTDVSTEHACQLSFDGSGGPYTWDGATL